MRRLSARSRTKAKSSDLIVADAFQALQEEYVVIGKDRVRSWDAWLTLGFIVGISATLIFVSNRGGEFEKSSAFEDWFPEDMNFYDMSDINTSWLATQPIVQSGNYFYQDIANSFNYDEVGSNDFFDSLRDTITDFSLDVNLEQYVRNLQDEEFESFQDDAENYLKFFGVSEKEIDVINNEFYFISPEARAKFESELSITDDPNGDLLIAMNNARAEELAREFDLLYGSAQKRISKFFPNIAIGFDDSIHNVRKEAFFDALEYILVKSGDVMMQNADLKILVVGEQEYLDILKIGRNSLAGLPDGLTVVNAVDASKKVFGSEYKYGMIICTDCLDMKGEAFGEDSFSHILAHELKHVSDFERKGVFLDSDDRKLFEECKLLGGGCFATAYASSKETEMGPENFACEIVGAPFCTKMENISGSLPVLQNFSKQYEKLIRDGALNVSAGGDDVILNNDFGVSPFNLAVTDGENFKSLLSAIDRKLTTVAGNNANLSLSETVEMTRNLAGAAADVAEIAHLDARVSIARKDEADEKAEESLAIISELDSYAPVLASGKRVLDAIRNGSISAYEISEILLKASIGSSKLKSLQPTKTKVNITSQPSKKYLSFETLLSKGMEVIANELTATVLTKQDKDLISALAATRVKALEEAGTVGDKGMINAKKALDLANPKTVDPLMEQANDALNAARGAAHAKGTVAANEAFVRAQSEYNNALRASNTLKSTVGGSIRESVGFYSRSNVLPAAITKVKSYTSSKSPLKKALSDFASKVEAAQKAEMEKLSAANEMLASARGEIENAKARGTFGSTAEAQLKTGAEKIQRALNHLAGKAPAKQYAKEPAYLKTVAFKKAIKALNTSKKNVDANLKKIKYPEKKIDLVQDVRDYAYIIKNELADAERETQNLKNAIQNIKAITNGINTGQAAGTLPSDESVSNNTNTQSNVIIQNKITTEITSFTVDKDRINSGEVATFIISGADNSQLAFALSCPEGVSAKSASNSEICNTAVTLPIGTKQYSLIFTNPHNSEAGIAAVLKITDASVSITLTRTLKVIATQSASASIICSAVNGLLAQFKFDANSAADSSCSNNNGQVIGGSFADGKTNFGKALILNGSGQYVNIPDSSLLDASQITISAWIKTTATAGTIADRFLLINNKGYGWRLGLQEISDKPGKATIFGTIYINGDNHNPWPYGQGPVINDGNWHHVAMTSNGSQGTWYVDGIFTTNQGNPFGTGNINDVNAPLTIGKGETGFFNGLIDDVRLYNRALSWGEINNLFRESQ
ncbi:hypothetical protein HYW53_02045 [Candidatus Giovannonibacteria bacterium]|nr:hypothetical protein [Candidatus Giovannonibacteria bacterium]